MLASPYADLAYAPSPRAVVECGPYSRPDLGCKDERRDSAAAYSQAIAWVVTGNERYARNAIGGKSAWLCPCQIRRYALYRQCVERVCAEHGS